MAESEWGRERGELTRQEEERSGGKRQRKPGQGEAIDSEKLFLAAQFCHFLWHGPLRSLLVMLILISEVGTAALAGLGFIVVLIPLQEYLARSIGAIRRKMVEITDERVKRTSEFLQAIRVVKLYAWEVPMEQRIEEVRSQEVTLLGEYLEANGKLRELMFAAQPLAALIIFVTAVYGQGQVLNIKTVFRVLVFLNITRFPLNLLAQALKNVSDGEVSLKRLNAYFLLETLESFHSVKRRESEREGEVKDDKHKLSESQEEEDILPGILISPDLRGRRGPPSRQYPTHWGKPPSPRRPSSAAATGDLVPLPGNYGVGSISLCEWIQSRLLQDDQTYYAAAAAAASSSAALQSSKADSKQSCDQVSLVNATFRWTSVGKPASPSKKSPSKAPSPPLASPAADEDSALVDTKASIGKFALTNLNFSTTPSQGELIAVIGAVGSGKSTFMSALLQEVPLVDGRADLQYCTGNAAYCAQTPWIQNLSVKDNVEA